MDVSLAAAVAMARMQARLHVSATFYIMARSPYYNPWSAEGAAALREIVLCGHRLGLHVDLDAARDTMVTMATLTAMAEDDRNLLPATSCALSLHCPPASLLWVDVPGHDYAYAPAWRGRYLSDSRGLFAFGDPEDHSARPLQVSLHPEHWFGGMPPTGDRPAFWR